MKLLFTSGLLTVVYTVPFLIGAILPGWRSIVGALAALALLTLAWSTVSGQAGWLEAAFATIGPIGLMTGIVARTLSLWIAPYGSRPLLAFFIATISYFAAPMLWAGPTKSWQWISRSLHQCADTQFSVLVGEDVLHIPSAPIFAVSLPRAKAPGDETGHFSFWSPSSVRAFCDKVRESSGPVGPSLIWLLPIELDRLGARRWQTSFCATPRNARDTLICRLADKGDPVHKIQRAWIYGDNVAEDVHRTRGSEIDDRVSRWLSEGRPPHPTGMDAPAGGLRIFPHPSLVGTSSDPFGMACTSGDAISCAAAGTLDNGLHVLFTIRTTSDAAVSDVRESRAYLNDLTRAMSMP